MLFPPRKAPDPALRQRAGQMSDDTGAAALLEGLPEANWRLADRIYGGDGYRGALKDKELSPAFLDVSLA